MHETETKFDAKLSSKRSRAAPGRIRTETELEAKLSSNTSHPSIFASRNCFTAVSELTGE